MPQPGWQRWVEENHKSIGAAHWHFLTNAMDMADFINGCSWRQSTTWTLHDLGRTLEQPTPMLRRIPCP